MAIRANKRYVGKVSSGSSLIEVGANNTPAYQVNLTCEDGDTSFNIWLTDKSRKNALKYFGILGVSEGQLSNPTYIEFQLGVDINGKEVVFEAKDDPQYGTQVAWIGKKPSPNLAKDAARFFSNTSGNSNTHDENQERPIDDSDIPF
jgi:hypothetical protein